jgi:glutaredoxin
MLVKILREGLGRIIVLGDKITRPERIERSFEAQARVDEQAKGLSMYQFFACPFCVKARRAIHRLNIPIEYRNAQRPGQHRDDLTKFGGVIKVPCLRIEKDGEDQWMYESNDIIAYLEQQFGTTA